MDIQVVQQEVQEALRGALGNGHGIDHRRMVAANASLASTFQSLPKNEHGRISSSAMRYAVQRYFSKNHGWVIKGFKSHSTEQEVQDGGLLGSKIPGYVEATLEETLQKGGFSLSNVLTIVIVVERLIFDEVAQSVEGAYHLNHLTTSSFIDRDSLLAVIESHLIVEMMERHEFDEELHEEDKQEIHELYPNWNTLQDFVRDVVGMETSAVLGDGSQSPFSRIGKDVFSFDDTVRIAQRISNEYGRWGNQECMELRSFLSDLDNSAAGRVRLSDFYKVGDSNAKWSFLETPDYLRGLGALDESSKMLGPQVIISNYVYGMSNCLTSTPYYSVCCLNECEGLLQHIEEGVAKPSATPSEILESIQRLRITSLTSAVGNALELSDKLRIRLKEIAAKGHGQVSLHGRLFAQWLHYAFPYECPFPHAAGSLQPQTQGERLSKGEDIFLEPDAISKHIQQIEVERNKTSWEHVEEELWSWDEELMHAPESNMSTRRPGRAAWGPWPAVVAASVLLIVLHLNNVVAAASKRHMLLPTSLKSHDL
jgi:hypothetical protein